MTKGDKTYLVRARLLESSLYTIDSMVLVVLLPNSYALRFTLPLFCKVYIGGLGSV